MSSQKKAIDKPYLITQFGNFLNKKVKPLTEAKIDKTSIVNSLDSEDATKVLSAAQGKVVNDKVEGVGKSLGKCKNLLKCTLGTVTQNGIECRAVGDGTYVLNGTASTDAYIVVGSFYGQKSITYHIVGCPNANESHNFYLRAGLYRGDDILDNFEDYGDGADVSLSWVSTANNIKIIFVIKAGYACNNLVFKPMLVDASISPDVTYDDFVPYTGEGDTLTADVATLSNSNLDLKMLGYTTPEEMAVKNYVDSERNFHQRVGRVDLSGLKWSTHTSYIRAELSNAKSGGLAFLDNYIYKSYYPNIQNDLTNGQYTITSSYYSDVTYILFAGDTIPSGYLYYELAEEIVIPMDGNEAVYNADKSTIVNLLNPTLRGTVEQNGVTCTYNGDGTYVLNGTVRDADYISFMLLSNANMPYGWNGKKLIGVPNNNVAFFIEHNSAPWVGHGANNEIIHDLPKDSDYRCNLFLRAYNGASFSNYVVRPMITSNLSATYDDFVPYTGSTGRLNSDVAEIVSKINNIQTVALHVFISEENYTIDLQKLMNCQRGVFIIATATDYYNASHGVWIYGFGSSNQSFITPLSVTNATLVNGDDIGRVVFNPNFSSEQDYIVTITKIA